MRRTALKIVGVVLYLWIALVTGRYFYAVNSYDKTTWLRLHNDFIMIGAFAAGVGWPIYWPAKYLWRFAVWSTDWAAELPVPPPETVEAP